MNQFYLILFILLISVSGCSSSAREPNAAEALPDIPVITVGSRDTVMHTAYVASIKAHQNTEIRSRVHGFLERILVDEGMHVAKDQPLFQLSTGEFVINDAKARALNDMAVAEAKVAALEVERVSILVQRKVVTPTELDLAKARLKAAEAKVNETSASLSEAKLKKSYTTIRAPFAGIINQLPLKTGSLIEEGTMLTSLSDVQSIFAYFSVSENEYLRWARVKQSTGHQADTVSLVMSDGAPYEAMGVIETMTGEIDPGTGSLIFRARFPNPRGLLKHGATGKVIIQSRVTNTLVVPQKAVFEIQDRNYVFVVEQNNVIRQRAFEPAARLGQYYLVKSGLQQGERIVYEGTQNLREGNKINPKKVAAYITK